MRCGRSVPVRSPSYSDITIELTYTSNAIEGNTLTHRETAEVVEHGITVGGKPLRDHLEAVDHHATIGWVRDIAGGDVPIDEGLVMEIHRRIVARSVSEIAGSYSTHPRRIAGSRAILNPTKIPALMAALGAWLGTANAIRARRSTRITVLPPSIRSPTATAGPRGC